MNRLHQIVLVASTLLGSWLGMQAIHECGHVLGAWRTGGRVVQVVLHPLTISRTDLGENPNPLVVVWSGPLIGVAVPLLLWAIAMAMRLPGTFVFRFFAGFCLVANGLYIGVGSFERIGDCGVMLQHGSAMWQLWLFGALTVPVGLTIWHGEGPQFGFGAAKGRVNRRVAYRSLAAFLTWVIVALCIGGE